MSLLQKTCRTLIIALPGVIFSGAEAAEHARTVADPCYVETLKIHQTDAKPSVMPCKRSLRNREYESKEDRSVKLYNLALIQKALGEHEQALKNLSASVTLTKKVDHRQLAFAQLLHKSGDFDAARTYYELLLAHPEACLDKLATEAIKRNLARLSHLVASGS